MNGWWMDGWVGGWGWVDRFGWMVDGWMDGWMDGWLHVQVKCILLIDSEKTDRPMAR